MFDPPPAGSGENEATWRALLLGTDPRMARTRARLKHLPSEPRCKMCAAPFGGIGYPLMRILVEHDAIVDKFVGDEVIGIFIPALAHDAHAARAIAAGLALLRAMQPV